MQMLFLGPSDSFHPVLHLAYIETMSSKIRRDNNCEYRLRVNEKLDTYTVSSIAPNSTFWNIFKINPYYRNLGSFRLTFIMNYT
jgi:hypothetical protein